MKRILGLILELNPAHNGHQYFINEAKKKINPDVTVAILSSSFTMRGDVSVIDKFTKTSLALEMGVDIVLELPFLSAINSADLFAYNSIKTLIEMQITDIAFGVELDNLPKLFQMRDIINSDEFNEQVKNHLKKGLSYSTSSYRALMSLINDQEIVANFTLPNNTLAIQYLRSIKELDQNLNITLIKRISNNYFDLKTTGPISSATAIRILIEENKDVKEFIPKFKQNIDFINIKETYQNIFHILKYLFAIKDGSYFQDILGVNEGIENRINTFLEQSKNYDELVNNIQTKRYSINKIKRLLLHIIMKTNKNYENQSHDYLRILGFNKLGKAYLNTLPKSVKPKIITSFKNKTDNELVQNELKATKLYGILTNKPNLYLEEFKIPITGGENEY